MFFFFKKYFRITARLFLSAALGLIILSCTKKDSDKVLTVYNTTFEPEDLKLKKIYSIESPDISCPADFKFNAAGELFVLENLSGKIKIFDQKNFDIKDSIVLPDDAFMSSFNFIKDDIVLSGSDRKIYIYDRKLNTYKIKKTDNGMPENIELLAQDKIFGTFVINTSGREETFLGLDLKMVDKNFDNIKLLSSFFTPYHRGDIDPEIPVFPFAADKTNEILYVAISSEKVYKIFAYEFDLNLKFIIRNKLNTQKFTDKELERIKKVAEKFKKAPFKRKDKTFIEDMFIDDEGRLWVRRASSAKKYGTDTSLFDIYDDEKYMLTVKIDKGQRCGRIMVKNNKIFISDPLGSKISVFSFDNKKIRDKE
ncbi:MAG: hypothetical protein R6V47_01890 [Candidatus Delongbacteria bacterium]